MILSSYPGVRCVLPLFNSCLNSFLELSFYQTHSLLVKLISKYFLLSDKFNLYCGWFLFPIFLNVEFSIMRVLLALCLKLRAMGDYIFLKCLK